MKKTTPQGASPIDEPQKSAVLKPKFGRGKNPASRRKSGHRKLVRINRLVYEGQESVTSERLRFLVEKFGL